MIQYIVIYGSLETGHTFYGPFNDMSTALLWAAGKWGSTLYRVQILPLVTVG